MFKKVLVAEDISSINEGLKLALNQIGVDNITSVVYCDKAYVSLKEALQNNDPFDLLITDLSFKKEYTAQELRGGRDLLQKLKDENITLKKLVFSVESRVENVRWLFDNFDIDAYVCKGRRDQEELSKALKKMKEGEKHASPEVESALLNSSTIEITDYDISLLGELQCGKNQNEISSSFCDKGISPSSRSGIEKRINKLKIYFKAKNLVHLVAKAKDVGLI